MLTSNYIEVIKQLYSNYKAVLFIYIGIYFPVAYFPFSFFFSNNI